MKYVSIFMFLIFVGCKQNSPSISSTSVNKDSLEAVLLKVDNNWSQHSLLNGYFHSRLDFVADNGIVMIQGSMPLNGKKAIEIYADSHSDSAFAMQWKPVKASVAESGDLGYTYGSWMMKTKTKSGSDTALHGNYVTVWQKQTDGSWKFVVDGGNDTPQEIKE